MARTERMTDELESSNDFFFLFGFLVTSVKLERFSVDLQKQI